MFNSKESLLEAIFANGEDETKTVTTIARHIVGNTAWVVTKVQNKTTGEDLRYIAQYRCHQNDDGLWDFKATPEMAGIPSLDCPVQLLDLASPAQQLNHTASAWREEVQEYHQILAEQDSAENALLEELMGSIYPEDTSYEFAGYAF